MNERVGAGRGRWILLAVALAGVSGFLLLRCGGTSGDASGGDDDAAAQATPPTPGDFVGPWETRTVHELGGTCYAESQREALPPQKFVVSSPQPGALRLEGYGVPLTVSGSSASASGQGSVSATISKTGSVVTNRLTGWSLTLGPSPILTFTASVETLKTTGETLTCTVSLRADAVRGAPTAAP